MAIHPHLYAFLLADASKCVLVHQHSAGLLRPAYALIADEAVESIVLCIRGTQSMKDLFTSLAGAWLCVGTLCLG